MASGTFDHNRVGCVGSGYCLIGCAYDAKKGAHLTYLPAALAAGATVYTDCRVERIERLAGGARRARRRGRARDAGRALPLRVDAERVVLSAGTIHTPASSGARARAGPAALGRNLSLQPQLPVVAEFDDDRRIELWRGIPQSAFASAADDDAEHGLGGFDVEGINGRWRTRQPCSRASGTPTRSS